MERLRRQHDRAGERGRLVGSRHGRNILARGHLESCHTRLLFQAEVGRGCSADTGQLGTIKIMPKLEAH